MYSRIAKCLCIIDKVINIHIIPIFYALDGNRNGYSFAFVDGLPFGDAVFQVNLDVIHTVISAGIVNNFQHSALRQVAGDGNTGGRIRQDVIRMVHATIILATNFAVNMVLRRRKDQGVHIIGITLSDIVLEHPARISKAFRGRTTNHRNLIPQRIDFPAACFLACRFVGNDFIIGVNGICINSQQHILGKLFREKTIRCRTPTLRRRGFQHLHKVFLIRVHHSKVSHILTIIIRCGLCFALHGVDGHGNIAEHHQQRQQKGNYSVLHRLLHSPTS